MKHNVYYSPEFLKDLFSIEEYIKTQFCDPEAAERIVNGIVDATQILKEYPESGAKVYLPGGLDSGYRFVLFHEYLAVYMIRNEDVYISRVVHEKQDYLSVLFPWLHLKD